MTMRCLSFWVRGFFWRTPIPYHGDYRCWARGQKYLDLADRCQYSLYHFRRWYHSREMVMRIGVCPRCGVTPWLEPFHGQWLWVCRCAPAETFYTDNTLPVIKPIDEPESK